MIVDFVMIDPSINNIGFAIYKFRKIQDIGTMYTKEKEDEARLYEILSWIDILMETYSLRKIVIERPKFYDRTGGKIRKPLMLLNSVVYSLFGYAIHANWGVDFEEALNISKDQQALIAQNLHSEAMKNSEHARAALVLLDRYLTRQKIEKARTS